MEIIVNMRTYKGEDGIKVVLYDPATGLGSWATDADEAKAIERAEAAFLSEYQNCLSDVTHTIKVEETLQKNAVNFAAKLAKAKNISTPNQ